MAAQHKRPGQTARMERIRRARKRKKRRQKVTVLLPWGRRRYDEFPGKIVAIGIPEEGIA